MKRTTESKGDKWRRLLGLNPAGLVALAQSISSTESTMNTTQLEQLKVKVQQLQDELKHANSKHADQQTKLAKLTQEKREVEDLYQDIEDLLQDIEDLEQANISRMEEQYAKQEKQLEESKFVNKLLQATVESAYIIKDSEVGQLRAEKEKLQENLDTKNLRIEELGKNMQDLEDKLKKSNCQISLLETTIESCTIAKDSEVGQQQAENEKLQEDLDTQKFRMKELEKQTIDLKNQVEELSSKIEIQGGERQELESSYAELKNFCESLTTKNNELQSICDNFNSELEGKDSNVSQLNDEVSCKGMAENIYRFPVGTPVLKQFDTKLYFGIIKEHDPERDFYKVVYDDNDQEELDFDEVNEHLYAKKIKTIDTSVFKERLCKLLKLVQLGNHLSGEDAKNILGDFINLPQIVQYTIMLELAEDDPSIEESWKVLVQMVQLPMIKSQKFPIGTPVLKKFDDTKWYLGMIIKHDPESNFFKVVYDDNDAEELDFDEVNEHLYVNKIKSINASVSEFKKKLRQLVKLVELRGDVSREDITNILVDYIDFPQVIQYTILLSELDEEFFPVEKSREVFIKMLQLPMMKPQEFTGMHIISTLLQSFMLFSYTEQMEIISHMETDLVFCFLEHPTCSIKQCFKKIKKYGRCCDHQAGYNSKKPRCGFPGCTTRVYKKGFCAQHLKKKDDLKKERGNFDDINSIVQLYSNKKE